MSNSLTPGSDPVTIENLLAKATGTAWQRLPRTGPLTTYMCTSNPLLRILPWDDTTLRELESLVCTELQSFTYNVLSEHFPQLRLREPDPHDTAGEARVWLTQVSRADRLSARMMMHYSPDGTLHKGEWCSIVGCITTEEMLVAQVRKAFVRISERGPSAVAGVEGVPRKPRAVAGWSDAYGDDVCDELRVAPTSLDRVMEQFPTQVENPLSAAFEAELRRARAEIEAVTDAVKTRALNIPSSFLQGDIYDESRVLLPSPRPAEMPELSTEDMPAQVADYLMMLQFLRLLSKACISGGCELQTRYTRAVVEHARAFGVEDATCSQHIADMRKFLTVMGTRNGSKFRMSHIVRHAAFTKPTEEEVKQQLRPGMKILAEYRAEQQEYCAAMERVIIDHARRLGVTGPIVVEAHIDSRDVLTSVSLRGDLQGRLFAMSLPWHPFHVVAGAPVIADVEETAIVEWYCDLNAALQDLGNMRREHHKRGMLRANHAVCVAAHRLGVSDVRVHIDVQDERLPTSAAVQDTFVVRVTGWRSGVPFCARHTMPAHSPTAQLSSFDAQSDLACGVHLLAQCLAQGRGLVALTQAVVAHAGRLGVEHAKVRVSCTQAGALVSLIGTLSGAYFNISGEWRS